MSAAHRRSLPVTVHEHSQFTTHRKQLQLGEGSLNKDLHISSLGSFADDHELSNRKFVLPSVVPRHSNEDIGRLEAQNASEQDEAPPCLPEDITRKKIETMKIARYRGKLPKLKGNRPNYSMSYQAGKKEMTRIPRKRGRSYSFSDGMNTLQTELELDSKNINETKQSVKLRSLHETQMPSARHCVSASYSDINDGQYASDDVNRSTLKKRRNQHCIGVQDTLLEKDLPLRVKEFLHKPQPKASTPSLRIKKIPDIHLEEQGKGINYEISLREQFTGVPINTNSCPLMSHFKDRKWYYQDKSGKCRYLRVPESPIPPVSFVFAKD